jgi:DNA repair exonuclease SbcCD ATPase subunit
VQTALALDNASAQAHAKATEERIQACMDLDAYKRIKLQAELATIAASIAQATTVLQNDKLAHTYAEYERNEKIHQAIAGHTTLITTLEQELTTARQNQESYALAAEVPELNRKLGVLQTKIADLHAMQAQNQSRLLLEPPLVATIKRNQAYIDALSDPTLKMRLVTKSANMLAQAANDILAQITDFTICAQTDTNSVEFVIKENSPMFTYPISISSGFQKFITSIALRLALVMIIPQKCEMILIDEGISVLDAQNMSKLPLLLNSIAPMFKFLFMISHVPELHNSLTYPLYIKNIDSPQGPTSYISNVTTTKRDTTIRGMQPCFRSSPVTHTANHAVDRNGQANAHAADQHNTVDQAVAAALMLAPVATAAAPIPAPNATAYADSVTCECGATVKKASLTAHKKTAKHLKLIPAK